MTSAFAGKSAMRSRATRCSSVWFWMSGLCDIMTFIRRSVSASCTRGWLNAFARDSYVMSALFSQNYGYEGNWSAAHRRVWARCPQR